MYAEEPKRLTLALAQCDRTDGGVAVALIESSFYISRNIMFRDASNLLPRRHECQVSRYSMYHHVDEPLLSAQAPRRAPRPDPPADHRGHDRAAPDDRTEGHDGERDRRARAGREGDRVPPLPRRADTLSRLQRAVHRATPLPRSRPLAGDRRPDRAVADRPTRDLRLPPRHRGDVHPRPRRRPRPRGDGALPRALAPRRRRPHQALAGTRPSPNIAARRDRGRAQLRHLAHAHARAAAHRPTSPRADAPPDLRLRRRPARADEQRRARQALRSFSALVRSPTRADARIPHWALLGAKPYDSNS